MLSGLTGGHLFCPFLPSFAGPSEDRLRELNCSGRNLDKLVRTQVFTHPSNLDATCAVGLEVEPSVLTF